MSTVFCRACGHALHESATDCPSCGAKQQVYTKSKVTAVLLCFFFGFMGIHRFYLGRPFSGVMYILFAGLALTFSSRLSKQLFCCAPVSRRLTVSMG